MRLENQQQKSNNMFESHYFAVLCLTIMHTTVQASKTPSQLLNFTLDINVISNSNISSPVVSPSAFKLFPGQIGNWTTKNKYVQIIDICELKKNFFICPNFYGTTCGQQFLDTDSDSNNEIYYQRFTFAETAEFQVKFDWISEISYLLLSTGVSVYWNGVLVDSFYSNNCTLYTSVYYVMGKVGANELAFQGIGILDSQGILLRNIQLRKITYIQPVSSKPSNSSLISNASNQSSSNLASSNNTNSTSNNSSLAYNTTQTFNATSSVSNNSSNSPLNNSTPNEDNLYSNSSDYSNGTLDGSRNSKNDTTTSNSADSTSNDTLSNSTQPLNCSESSNSAQPCNSSSQDNSSRQGSSTNPASKNAPNQINNSPTYIPDNTTNASSYSYSLSFEAMQSMYNNTQYTALFAMFKFSQKYKLVKYCSSIFSSQQNIKFLVGFLMELNHMILYNYHIRNYTLMSNFILVGIQALDDQKALIIDEYVYPALEITPTSILEDFTYQNTLPNNVGNIITEFSKRPNGILLEISDLFLVDVPVTLTVFLLGNLLFRLFFNFRISILFRQYSLYGLFFFVLLNGKMEIITFYFLSQLLLMNSSRFIMKVQVIVILCFFFFIFLFSIGLMMLYRSSYRTLTRLIYENCRKPEDSLIFMTFSFGIYNILLGLVHRLFLSLPNLQIYLLTTIQVLYLIAIIYLLFQRFFENTILGIVLIIMNMIRIVFNTTYILYNFYPQLEIQISEVQQFSFYSLIATWGISLLLTIWQKFFLIYKIIRQSLKSNRIKPARRSKKVEFKDLKSNTALCSRSKFTPRFQKSQNYCEEVNQNIFDFIIKPVKFKSLNRHNTKTNEKKAREKDHASQVGEKISIFQDQNKTMPPWY